MWSAGGAAVGEPAALPSPSFRPDSQRAAGPSTVGSHLCGSPPSLLLAMAAKTPSGWHGRSPPAGHPLPPLPPQIRWPESRRLTTREPLERLPEPTSGREGLSPRGGGTTGPLPSHLHPSLAAHGRRESRMQLPSFLTARSRWPASSPPSLDALSLASHPPWWAGIHRTSDGEVQATESGGEAPARQRQRRRRRTGETGEKGPGAACFKRATCPSMRAARCAGPRAQRTKRAGLPARAHGSQHARA